MMGSRYGPIFGRGLAGTAYDLKQNVMGLSENEIQTNKDIIASVISTNPLVPISFILDFWQSKVSKKHFLGIAAIITKQFNKIKILLGVYDFDALEIEQSSLTDDEKKQIHENYKLVLKKNTKSNNKNNNTNNTNTNNADSEQTISTQEEREQQKTFAILQQKKFEYEDDMGHKQYISITQKTKSNILHWIQTLITNYKIKEFASTIEDIYL